MVWSRRHGVPSRIGHWELLYIVLQAEKNDPEADTDLVVMGFAKDKKVRALQRLAAIKYLTEMAWDPALVTRPWIGAATCPKCKQSIVRMAGYESAASTTTCKACDKKLAVRPWQMPELIDVQDFRKHLPGARG